MELNALGLCLLFSFSRVASPPLHAQRSTLISRESSFDCPVERYAITYKLLGQQQDIRLSERRFARALHPRRGRGRCGLHTCTPRTPNVHGCAVHATWYVS